MHGAKVDLSKIYEHLQAGNQHIEKTAKEAGLDDIDTRFKDLVEAMESLIEEVGAAGTELVERLRERMDAAAPAMDDIAELLNRCAGALAAQ